MYAVIELGGRQWKVEPGTQLDVNRLPSDVGATQTVERVLAAHDGSHLQVGRPYVEGARVVCEVLAHRKGPKVVSYRFRRRENWRKTVGHRQRLTRLVIKDIVLPGGTSTGRGDGA
jgi:large subunit ribosomal protein L21